MVAESPLNRTRRHNSSASSRPVQSWRRKRPTRFIQSTIVTGILPSSWTCSGRARQRAIDTRNNIDTAVAPSAPRGVSEDEPVPPNATHAAQYNRWLGILLLTASSVGPLSLSTPAALPNVFILLLAEATSLITGAIIGGDPPRLATHVCPSSFRACCRGSDPGGASRAFPFMRSVMSEASKRIVNNTTHRLSSAHSSSPIRNFWRVYCSYRSAV